MLVLFGNRYHKSQIGCYKFVLSAFALRTSFFDFLRKLNLFINGYQRSTTNFDKIFVKCFTRTVCNPFLNFKLSHLIYLNFLTRNKLMSVFAKVTKTLQRYDFLPIHTNLNMQNLCVACILFFILVVFLKKIVPLRNIRLRIGSLTS